MSSAPVAQTISALVEVNLDQLATSPDVLLIKELPFMSHINLRGSSDNTAYMDRMASLIGLDMPKLANTYVANELRTLMWLGPNEWLLVDEQPSAAQLLALLRDASNASFASVHEVTGANVVLEISGSKAQALLAKGCPMDLHDREFGVGDCAQTLLAKSGIILWKTDDAPVFRVIVRRSFADYVGLWLLDAAREFTD